MFAFEWHYDIIQLIAYPRMCQSSNEEVHTTTICLFLQINSWLSYLLYPLKIFPCWCVSFIAFLGYGYCYLFIQVAGVSNNISKEKDISLQFIKIWSIIFAAFAICWTPSTILVVSINISHSHEVPDKRQDGNIAVLSITLIEQNFKCWIYISSNFFYFESPFLPKWQSLDIQVGHG